MCKAQTFLSDVLTALHKCKLADFIHKSKHETSLLYFYPAYTCWFKGMRHESFSKRFWGNMAGKSWSQIYGCIQRPERLFPMNSRWVFNQRPPLRSHWDKWYFRSAILRSWRRAVLIPKAILTGESSNASPSSWNNKKMATCPKGLPHSHPHEIGDSLRLENEMLHSISQCPCVTITADYRICSREPCSVMFMSNVNTEQRRKKRKGPGQLEALLGSLPPSEVLRASFRI